MAHELGHHVNRDIPVGILVSSVITLGGLYLAHLILLWGVNFFSFEGVWDLAALPLFMLVMGAYGLVTMPLSNAYSRWRGWPIRTWRMLTLSRGWSGCCIRSRR